MLPHIRLEILSCIFVFSFVKVKKWKSLSCVQLFVTQARILEWGAFPISRESSQPRSPALQVDSLPAQPQGKPKNTGVGSLSLLQWIFPIQESNRSLLHCRRILYWLSYHRSPLFRKGWQLSKHMRTLFLSRFLYNFSPLPPALQVCLFSSCFLYMWWWWWWFSRSVRSDSCDPTDYSLPGSSVHGIL